MYSFNSALQYSFAGLSGVSIPVLLAVVKDRVFGNIKKRESGSCRILKSTQITREEMVQKIKEFCLMDDTFMSRVFDENIECTELILRIILDMPELKVRQVKTQYEIKNLLGHSVRMDIKAEDSDGRPLNVEVQNENEGAEPKRARYNSSLLDTNTLKKSEEYDKLPESYVIFITRNDVLKGGKLIYHADRVVAETGKLFGDEAHIIYVNSSHHDESPLGKLMRDFRCKNPNEMHYKLLAEQTRYYKESEEGESAMCRIMEELIESDRKETAIELLKDGRMSNEEIAQIVRLSVGVINELEKELEAVPS